MEIYNLIRDQSLTSETCGYFAVVFLRDRLNNIPFKIASGFNKLGEKRIADIKKHLQPFSEVNGINGDGWRDVLTKAYAGAKEIGKRFVKAVTGTSARSGWSPSIRKLLEKYGNNKIHSIKIYREPIKSVLHNVLNWVSNGTF